MMKIIFKFLVILVFAKSVLADDTYPDLNNVNVGEPYSHPRAGDLPDLDRPTTQFRAPNYGETSQIFPEYQVVILNSNNNVVIVSAEAIMPTQDECNEKLASFKKILNKKYNGYKLTEEYKKNLQGVTEYSSGNNNEYYGLDCMRRHGPFWILNYQMRGQKQDELLKKAWDEYFKNR